MGFILKSNINIEDRRNGCLLKGILPKIIDKFKNLKEMRNLACQTIFSEVYNADLIPLN